MALAIRNRGLSLPKGLAALILLTLAGLLLNEFGMTRVLRLDGRQRGQRVEAADDRAQNGHSEARATPRPDGAWTVDCEIRPGFEWPFCEWQLVLDAQGIGLDLREFDVLRLALRASGPEAHPSLRIFLRNADPAYARREPGSGEWLDLKPHEVVFDPAAEASPVDFRLSQFAVSSWWTQSHPLRAAHTGPQLEHVMLMGISTGGTVRPGHYRIEIDRLELRGRWIAPASFRLGLIALWLGAGLAYLLWEWRRARLSLDQSQRGRLALQRAHAELKQRSRELQNLALHDPLTGVLNREGLRHDLQLLQRAQEELLFPLATVFVDVDHFKRVNDEHGHDTGDAVLRELAGLLRRNLQREDLIARWGGEEFLLLMPQTSADEAVAVCERLRQCLHEQAWPAGLALTASFGVAQATQADELDAANARADAAMYRAKHGGRDRVERG